jgi:hypothetical protein
MRNKNCLWWPCLLTDRDKMWKDYREPSIDAAFQVSGHLVKRCQRRRIFRNQPIRNKNCLWRPSLTDQEEMCNIHRGPSIDASYQVSVHWPPQAILVSDWLISNNLLLCNRLAKWTETSWEAPMEGSVLSFLKVEWKVSDTGSADWASSLLV